MKHLIHSSDFRFRSFMCKFSILDRHLENVSHFEFDSVKFGTHTHTHTHTHTQTHTHTHTIDILDLYIN